MTPWPIRRSLPVFSFALLLAASVAGDDTKDTAPKLDSEALAGLPARAIGPAVMSGRIAAIAGVPGDRTTLYVGSAGGGVWKSMDGGYTFKPIFDKYTQSIGAVAVDPSHTETVWVGTGESWVRNSVSVGTGVYKSTDAGENWQLVGLADTEHISRIAIHPKDSGTVLVCALGHLWNSNAERGVFRTTDGGKTWKQTLFVNEDTGCADIAQDPQDPRIVYAGMWQVRRYPWTFNSGGPGGGLYKSSDGGDTWKRITAGLPSGDLGRIGISIATSRPNVVYAVIEAKQTAVYRSEDLGENWKEMNSSSSVNARPFYFATVSADPKNFHRVYKPGYGLAVSDDDGKTFSGLGGGFHGDCHALWINPADPEQLFLGTDGGVYNSNDRGAHWRFIGSLPVGQFYHVSADMARPYNVYGGLQDNGTWTGPSQHAGGIAARHWQNIGFGDGFWAFPDPTDSDYAYVEWQGGKILRTRKSTGESKQIAPYARQGEPDLRFNWNAPIQTSESHPGTIYLGAEYLYRSRNRGESWERISPDLTTNDPAKEKQEQSGGLTVDNSDAERHCTIYAISESPKNPEVIWAGTDDGNLQITRDGGKNWSNVVKNVPGLPANTWVSYVDASHFEEGTAYATFDGHASGDMKTYAYRTRDYGKTWQPLVTADVSGYAHVIREDRVKANLLFLGTEFGLFVSIDSGANWAKFTGGLPPVAIRDIAIHPRDNDLLLATHGRGIWIVDDITPIRSLTADVLASDVVFLPSRPSEIRIASIEQRSDGDTDFVGHSPGDAAWVNYYLKKRHVFGDLRLEIYDAGGKLIYSAPGGQRRGLNRFEWPTRAKAPKAPPATSVGGNEFALIGPLVPEGTYTVRMIKDKDSYATQVNLVADPTSPHSASDRKLERDTAWRLYGLLDRLAYLTDAVSGLRDQARERAGKLAADDPLRKKLEALADSLENLRKSMVTTREGPLTGELQLREKLLDLYGAVNGYEGRPTESQLAGAGVLEHQLDADRARFESSASGDVPSLNAALADKKLEPLKPLTYDVWQKKDVAK
ncbi:MAG: WD40/YVTN/BNR-like repeat-containing protein [Candidatus Acidiferrales bacterium]